MERGGLCRKEGVMGVEEQGKRGRSGRRWMDNVGGDIKRHGGDLHSTSTSHKMVTNLNIIEVIMYVCIACVR